MKRVALAGVTLHGEARRSCRARGGRSRGGFAGRVAPGVALVLWRTAGWVSRPARGARRASATLLRARRSEPRPRGLDAKACSTAVEGEAGSDVQQAVAQAFRLGVGELADEQQRLGPEDQIVRDQHELEAGLVHLEVAEGKRAQPGVLVVADLILDPGPLALATFHDSDVLLVLVGEEDRAMSLVIGERQLSAPGARARGPRSTSSPTASWTDRRGE